jgi:hypothetical protein
VQALEHAEQFVAVPHVESHAVVPHKHDRLALLARLSDLDHRVLTGSGVLHRVREEVREHDTDESGITLDRG